MVDPKICMAQVKRMGGLSAYPKDIPEAVIEIAKKLSRECRNAEHVEATITEILNEPDRKFCPTIGELSPYIDRQRKSFELMPKSCGECIEGWTQAWWLMEIRKWSDREGWKPGWNREEITREQYEDLIPKVDQRTQRLYESVKPCDCPRGLLANAHWNKNNAKPAA